MARESTVWEKQTDAQRIQTLQDHLEEAYLAIKNLTHDVGRLAARVTVTETTVAEVAKSIDETNAKVLKKK